MAGLAGNEVDEVLQILFKLNETGITIIMIEHIMQAVMPLLAARGVPRCGQDHLRGHAGLDRARTPTCRKPTLALELTIRDVDAGYGAVRALHGVSITVSAGTTVALLGTNGNGKSTLMKCVMGIVAADARHDQPLDGRRDARPHRAFHEDIVNLGVAMVPEGRRLFPKLTVEENLLLERSDRWRAARSRRTALLLRDLPVLASGAASSPARCRADSSRCWPSARALMSRPSCCWSTSPPSGLAPILVSHTITKIKELKERYGLTVLMAEQNFTRRSHCRPRLHHRPRRDRL